jgi:putative MATE family efflux protein
MGVKGAAIATVIARAFSFFYSLYFLFYGKNVLKLQMKYFKYKWSIIKEILLIGLPASFSQSFMSIGMILMTKMVATYGDMAIAAFGIVGRLDSVAILPVIGVSTAAITLVGYHVGAKNYKRAEEITLKASLLAFLFGTFVGLIYFFFTKPIIGIFTNNPEITTISIAYLKIIALFTGISAIPFVIYSAFQGAGMAFPSLVLIFIRMFLLVIPFAYFFSIYMGYGIHFLWWAWPFSSVINALISVIWFRRGTWKRDCKGKMICY